MSACWLSGPVGSGDGSGDGDALADSLREKAGLATIAPRSLCAWPPVISWRASWRRPVRLMRIEKTTRSWLVPPGLLGGGGAAGGAGGGGGSGFGGGGTEKSGDGDGDASGDGEAEAPRDAAQHA